MKKITTATPIPTRTLARLAELPCDGIARFKVSGKDNLTYSDAYKAIFDEEKCYIDDETHKQHLRPGAIRRLQELNEVYSGLARAFILAEIPKRKAKQEAVAAEFATLKAFQDARSELEKEMATVPRDDTKIAALEKTIAESNWEMSGKGFRRKQLVAGDVPETAVEIPAS